MVSKTIKDIFDGLDLPYKETRFNKAPETTYCVFTENFLRRGADLKKCLREYHDYIEIYSTNIEDGEIAENKIESSMDSLNLEYNKSERVWFEDLSRYQVIYDFTFITKD